MDLWLYSPPKSVGISLRTSTNLSVAFNIFSNLASDPFIFSFRGAVFAFMAEPALFAGDDRAGNHSIPFFPSVTPGPTSETSAENS